jgi:sialate O-acetylesterase
MQSWLRIAALVFTVSLSARADVKLPALIADHMVVQRNLPVHVWGKAAPAEAVSVAFRGETRTATADAVGLWSLYLPSSEAGGPFEMTVKGDNTITLRDVMVGDVWVASGQSNMEWPVKNANNGQAEVAAASFPQIRLFRVRNLSATYPQDDVEGSPWAQCSPETVPEFSAIGYFFGRDLHRRLGVPVGLIDSSWGGTPADAWTSLRAISSDAALMPVFAEWSRMNDNAAVDKLWRQKRLSDWERASARAKAEGRPAPPFPWEPNEGNSWMPAGLFNAMIAPLTKYPIRGAIWYQGESNASPERVSLYSRLFRTMIQDWRNAWRQGDFPFLFVQLANYKAGPNARWPELREAQLQALALRNTGMAVAIDIGNPDDIHPRDKQTVGARLAAAARAISHGENIAYSGPLFRSAVPEAAAVRVFFDHSGTGLSARGGALRGFEIAGADRKFVPAEARIEGDAVVVSSPAVTAPVYVRYAWSDNPDCNLYNAEGLPASPFRSGQ